MLMPLPWSIMMCFAVSAHDFAQGHDSVGRSNNLGAIAAANIHAAMERAFTVERINPLTEAARHLAFDRP